MHTKLDITKTKNRLILSLFITTLLFLVTIFLIISTLQQNRINERQQEFQQQLDRGISHVIKHYIKDYTYRAKRMAQTTKVPVFMQNRDRESLYALIKPKWDLMLEEKIELKSMQFHLADGTSFLRMHMPEEYGDQLTDKRKMMKDMQTFHKLIQGYEKGVYVTLFRVIEPIFGSDGTYIGALEIGIDLDYIIHAVKDINGLNGAMFVLQDSYAGKQEKPFILDGFILSDQIYTKKCDIKALHSLMHPEIIKCSKGIFKTHIFDIKDYENVVRTKLVFFEDITTLNLFRGYFLYSFLLSGILFFVLLYFVIHRILTKYHSNVEKLYSQQIQKLHESEERLSMLYNNSPDMYVSVSAKDASVLLCNDTLVKMLGYEREEIVGKSVFNLYHEDALDQAREAFEQFVSKGEVNNKEMALKRKDGSKLYVALSVKAVRDSEGHVLYSNATWRDITQRVKLQNTLHEQEELMIMQSRQAAMGEMISMIAHQWRQPISTISMGVNNILADIELETLESEALEHTLEDILAQTSELSKTIDDFRNFFKPERVSEEVFVADVYADAYKVIEKSLYNNNIEVSLQNSSTLKVQTFSRELMQVFINLLNNAKDALLLDTRLDKKIFVTIEDKNNSVIIKICDNGGGVDSAIKERIFEPYFSTKEASSGTGLGLYMSKTILEKHLHSTIECLDVDEGACFEIVLHTL